MRTLFYVIWLAIPAVFFMLALWSKLEEFSGLPKKDRPGDMLKQALFLLLCSVFAILFDYFALDSLYEAISPDWIPMGLYQLLLLPFILLIAAKFIGPTKDIKISKSPKPTQRGKK